MKKKTIVGVFLLISMSLPGQEQLSDLSLQDAYLLKVASYINDDLTAEDDWQAYFDQLWGSIKAPSYLGPDGILFNPMGLLSTYEKTEMGLDPYRRYYENFPIGYLIQFYPEQYAGNTEHRTNEFAARRLQLEGKKKLLEDIKQLPFDEANYLYANASLGAYDFEAKAFPVDLNIQFLGLTDLNYNFYIPLFFDEDYKEQLANLHLKLPETAAEDLVKKLTSNTSPIYEINSKIVFTIHPEKAQQPIVKHNVRNISQNYAFFPWKYSINHIDLELHRRDAQGNLEFVELLHRYDDLQLPETASAKSTEKKTSVSPAPYPFLKLFAGDATRPYIDYTGNAINQAGSIHEVNRVQLRLNYLTYQDHAQYEFRELEPENMIGFLYFELGDKSNRLAWQRLYTYEPLPKQNGYRVTIGVNPQSKTIKKAGYKNGYFNMIFQEDHSVSIMLYDEKNVPQFFAVLNPLDKNAAPPFTRK